MLVALCTPKFQRNLREYSESTPGLDYNFAAVFLFNSWLNQNLKHERFRLLVGDICSSSPSLSEVPFPQIIQESVCQVKNSGSKECFLFPLIINAHRETLSYMAALISSCKAQLKLLHTSTQYSTHRELRVKKLQLKDDLKSNFRMV